MTDDVWIWQAEHLIPSTAEAARPVEEELLERLAADDWSERDIFGVRMAMEEAIVNAIRHGNCCDAGKSVHIVSKVAADRVRVEICDEGNGFCAGDVADCTQDENLDKASGRGIMLMRAFMTNVHYERDGKCVILEKTRAAG